MYSFHRCTLFILLFGLVGLGAQPAASSPHLTPSPQHITLHKGVFELSPNLKIVYSDISLEPLAEIVAGEIELICGFSPETKLFRKTDRAPRGALMLHLNHSSVSNKKQHQAYELLVGENILINSSHYKGIAYGTATLLQAIEMNNERFYVQQMVIQDNPKSTYRTVMIDIARRQHSVDALKDVIRLARYYKLSYVQIHLTDDQNFVFPFKPVTDHLEKNYTISREEWLKLVTFADNRGITLIPELDLPGHSTKLRQSGYLGEAKTDRDVADPQNYAKIQAIIDDMLSVFHSTPYFHIGGDESRAGDTLIPFLAAMNSHLRTKGKRMMVWEGFHGNPKELPATGDDRILVLSWESSYNPPWNLLKSDYEIVNACWKPLYIVGRGNPRHPGASTRMWSPETLYGWDIDTFMHWEPGRPVYEDRGPNDPNRTDSIWKASYIDRTDQVVGGQMLLWEQQEQWVFEDLSQRLPVFSERLWNPDTKRSYTDFTHTQTSVHERILTLMRPVSMSPETLEPSSPVSLDYRIYKGDSVEVTLSNRTKIKGEIRYEVGKFNNNLTYVYSHKIPQVSSSSPLYKGSLKKTNGFGIRARLFRKDGTPVQGTTWQVYNNWPQRVEVTDYKCGRQPLTEVPDLAEYDEDQILQRYWLPMLRGPYTHVSVLCQMQRAVLKIPQNGTYTLSAKTQSGHATVYLDLNQNDRWDVDENIIINTPKSEKVQGVELELKAGPYNLRVDHAAALPRPVLVLYLEGPGIDGRKEISPYLIPKNP